MSEKKATIKHIVVEVNKAKVLQSSIITWKRQSSTIQASRHIYYSLTSVTQHIFKSIYSNYIQPITVKRTALSHVTRAIFVMRSRPLWYFAHPLFSCSMVSFVGRGFFSLVSVFLSLVLSKVSTSLMSGLSLMVIGWWVKDGRDIK